MSSTSTPWLEWATAELAHIEGAGQRRTTRTFDAHGPRGSLDGRSVVSFASNDYLGLSTHPKVTQAAAEALERWGTGATASRLVVGHRPCHSELETELAAWKQAEAALVFPTGYAANLGVLTVLGGPDVAIFSDELNHASLIDGCRLSRSVVEVFRHGDLDHLDALLERHEGGRCVVVSDTVFSMDGDIADVEGLARRCARHGALLVLDEAHSVFGPEVDPASLDVEVIRVGTLSKTLGSLGGFATSSKLLVDLLLNRARPFIFTTGLTPADTAAALAALGVVRSEEGAALIRRVRAFVDRLAPAHPSPIVPIVIGDETEALAASDALMDQGILVPAIRPPTVAPGTSRLRVTVSAGHGDHEVDLLCAVLDDLGLR